MSDVEDLTAEEQSALAEMEQDTGEGLEEAQQAQEAPKDEPQEDEKPVFKTQREKPPEGFVPHEAMHAERMKAKAEREARETLEKRLAELEAKLAPKEEAPQWVDPLVDPEGFKRWSDHRDKTISERLEAQDQDRQERAERQRQEVAQAEAEFSAKTPDYLPTIEAMKQGRIAELRGAGLADQEIVAHLNADVRGIVQAAKLMGISPAELAYMRAHHLGHRADTQKTGQDEASRIVALAEAQKRTQGLGSAGGGAQAGKLTMAQLAEMSEEEIAKIPEAEIRAAMGG